MSGQAPTQWVVLSLDTYTRPANAAVRAEVVNDIAIAVRGVMQVHRPTIRPIITPDVRSDIVIHRYEASLLVEGDKDTIRDHITELLAREGVIRADDDVAQF